LRRHYLACFPHAIIYEVLTDQCVVVAFAHPSRRPNYWRDRLE
jgi:hypothetical protein